MATRPESLILFYYTGSGHGDKQMTNQEKIVRAKIKTEVELKRVVDYVKTHKDTPFFLDEKQEALQSEITVKHFQNLEELAKQLTEEHLKMVNLQITIKAMDAERTRLDAILRDKPQSIATLIKASGLTPQEIAKKLGISI